MSGKSSVEAFWRKAPIGALAVLMPAAASAHGSERAFVLLLPTGYYLAGGALAVAATFLLLACMPKGISYRLAGAQLALIALRPPNPIATSLLAFLLLGLLLATGIAGSRDPLSNPLPLTIWTLWWVGFTLATAVFGNLWAYANPWTGPYRLAMRLQRASKSSKALATPSPPPCGEGQGGGIAEHRGLGVPPPPTPPRVMSKTCLRHDGEGNPVAAPGSERSIRGETSKAGGQRSGRAEPLLPYPSWLGYWPAIVLFLGFAWFELIDIAPDDPERLAVAVGAYWLFTFIALVLFGEEAWLGRAEPFSVFFRFIGLLSPLVWTQRADGESKRRLALAMPGAALLGRSALPPSGVLFILLTLASVSFDGLSKTFWWLGLNGINPLEFPGRSAVVWINSAGLLLTWAVLACVYAGAVLLGWRLAGRPAPPRVLLGMLVFSIMPISLGFHFSHYLTALLVNGQYACAAASDPFGNGLDLLGLGHFHVTTSFLSTYEGTRAIWNAQTAGIVAGHVLAVLLAHELACRSIADYRAAVISQAPLAAVMVAYTLFGLWLLSTPVAG